MALQAAQKHLGKTTSWANSLTINLEIQ